MKDMPSPFWATIFLVLACVLAAMALYAPTRENVTMAVLTLASSIATGSFGYIQGHKDGAASMGQQPVQQPPVNPAPK